jgi:hypothetical protein
MEIADFGDVFAVFQTRGSSKGWNRCCTRGREQKWLWEQDFSFYRQGLENLIVSYDKCLNKFGNFVEK